MISIKFEEREKIGLQYALETLHGCSPFGQERIRLRRQRLGLGQVHQPVDMHRVRDDLLHAGVVAGAGTQDHAVSRSS